MLEQLFGSTTRVKLLRLFLRQPQQAFYIREISRKLKSSLNAVRRELNNLEKMGFLTSEAREENGEKRKYYQVDESNVFYPELKSLILKDQIILKNNLTKSIKDMRGIKLMILTGFFTDQAETQTDIVIVGRVNKTKIKKFLNKFQKVFHRTLNYTILTEQEYQYRMDITDRFLYNVLERKHIRVIDKLKKK